MKCYPREGFDSSEILAQHLRLASRLATECQVPAVESNMLKTVCNLVLYTYPESKFDRELCSCMNTKSASHDQQQELPAYMAAAGEVFS